MVRLNTRQKATKETVSLSFLLAPVFHTGVDLVIILKILYHYSYVGSHSLAVQENCFKNLAARSFLKLKKHFKN